MSQEEKDKIRVYALAAFVVTTMWMMVIGAISFLVWLFRL